jgi:hypothetical protein
MGKGGIIGKPNEPNSTVASGICNLREQYTAKRISFWPPSFWGRQRALTITTTNTTNLQVRVVLTTTNFDYSKCNSDGSDIRFVENNAGDVSTQALTYWNESWNNAGTSVFWVKVATSGLNTIYLRYGNNEATTQSNIDTTMEAGLRYRYYGAGGTSPTIPSSTLDGGGTDTDINDDWGSGTVSVAGFGSRSDSMGVIWDGWTKPNGSGNHIFYITTDDGGRLYIDTSLVINQWVDRGATENSYTFSSWTDGLPKRIQFDFYENAGGAGARLGWQSPNSAKAYPISPTFLRSPKYSSNYVDPFFHTGTIGTEVIL